MAKPAMTTEQEMSDLVNRAQRYRSLCLVMSEVLIDTTNGMTMADDGTAIHPELLPALSVVFEVIAAHLAETIHLVMRWAEPLRQIEEAPHGS